MQVLRGEADVIQAECPRDPEEALAKLRESHGMAVRLGHGFSAGVALDNMAKVEFGYRRLPEALEHWREASAAHRASGSTVGMAYSLKGAAECHQLQGDIEDAIEASLQALAAVDQMDGPESLRVQLCSMLQNMLAGREPERALAFRHRFAASLRACGRDPDCFGACAICYESMDDGGLLPVAIRPYCHHAFHAACWEQVGAVRCPTCRE